MSICVIDTIIEYRLDFAGLKLRFKQAKWGGVGRGIAPPKLSRGGAVW
ncbi:MAG: hypothetical protein Q7S43_00885 [bacterium]|nr:hypothetical protein [bacterium]